MPLIGDQALKRPGRVLVCNTETWRDYEAGRLHRSRLDMANADLAIVVRDGEYEVVKHRYRATPFLISWSELHMLLENFSSV